jgi:hypothetical protein
MSNERVSLETIRRVYDDDNGCFIEVGPDSDSLGCVEIRTTGEKNKGHWGEIRFAVPKQFALQLAEAIRRCAEEAE